ncbi:hypothetical protein PEPS_34550 (plasmid) [Persicobacter psychrovividus]|uniref:Uncharacterized protein n=1 Tax=Persicobacter psychrovividus TaxID=387638 RepID=A0ABN6LDG6_9BACT|nr:hypothetical protein PEPS_34550 [Persicobacter psychrovividus]
MTTNLHIHSHPFGDLSSQNGDTSSIYRPQKRVGQRSFKIATPFPCNQKKLKQHLGEAIFKVITNTGWRKTTATINHRNVYFSGSNIEELWSVLKLQMINANFKFLIALIVDFTLPLWE